MVGHCSHSNHHHPPQILNALPDLHVLVEGTSRTPAGPLPPQHQQRAVDALQPPYYLFLDRLGAAGQAYLAKTHLHALQLLRAGTTLQDSLRASYIPL